MTRTLRTASAALLAAAMAGSAATASAGIVVDYSLDQTGLFSSNAAARAAVEAAAADLNTVLDLNLTAIDNPTIVGAAGPNGRSTVTLDLQGEATIPDSPATTGTIPLVVAQNEFRIYAGGALIEGTTLGKGGSGGIGVGIGISVVTESEYAAATRTAEADANTLLNRGEGPVIGTLNSDLGQTPISLAFGPTFGQLSFDVDTDNDGVQDSAAALDAYWSFDHTADVEAGQNDFYSVALHEMLHTLGIGSSETWASLVSGSDWLGDELAALTAGGFGVINTDDDDDDAHFTSDLQGLIYGTAVLQEAVMDPTLTVGTRKLLTDLDVAALADIGYSVVAVPEPTSVALVGIGAAVLLRRRRSA